MTVGTLTATCPTSLTCQGPISATSMPDRSCNSTKSCILAFVSIISVKKTVHATRRPMTNAYLAYAAIGVCSRRTGCLRQRGNCRSRVSKTWMTWNPAHAKRQNALKNIARVLLRVVSVRTYANAISVRIATFTTTSHHNTQSILLTLICSMTGRCRCRKAWTLSLSSFRNFDF